MIETQHLIRFLGELPLNYGYEHTEYWFEIIKRLRAYDRICHDLKQLTATMSSGLDDETPWAEVDCHGHPDNPPIDSEDK